MSNFFKDLIFAVFGRHSWLGIIILSMIPVTELRVAIPFAMNAAVWGEFTLSWWQAWICAVVGSTLPAFVIIPLLIPVFEWMKKSRFFSKIANFFDKKFTKHAGKVNQKTLSIDESKQRLKKQFFGMLAFISAPVPLMGAWTGSAVISYLKMPFWLGMLCVFLGNIISGGIVVLISIFFAGYESWITFGFFILLVLLIAITVTVSLVKKHKKSRQSAVVKDDSVVQVLPSGETTQE